MSEAQTIAQRNLIVQPDDGVKPVLELVKTATQSLRIKQFTLTDPDVIAAVVERHRSGVSVEIMLNPHRSSGDRANDESFAHLKDAGLNVEWSNPAFAVTHEKSVIIDERLALIATFNMATKYFTLTRDHGMITTDPAQVTEITRCFAADRARQPFKPAADTGLLWSTENSRAHMAEFIDSAHHQLLIQHPKFVDATILDRLVQARMRGVDVRVLCGGKHGISDWDVFDTFSSLRILERLGAKIRRQKHLKLHSKLIIVDKKRALMGSMNIDRSAFDLRRELGVFLDKRPYLSALTKLFHHDWRQAKPYKAPDPLAPHTHNEGELPHDPDFIHE